LRICMHSYISNNIFLKNVFNFKAIEHYIDFF